MFTTIVAWPWVVFSREKTFWNRGTSYLNSKRRLFLSIQNVLLQCEWAVVWLVLTSWHQVDPVGVHSQAGDSIQVGHHRMDHFTFTTGQIYTSQYSDMADRINSQYRDTVWQTTEHVQNSPNSVYMTGLSHSPIWARIHWASQSEQLAEHRPLLFTYRIYCQRTWCPCPHGLWWWQAGWGDSLPCWCGWLQAELKTEERMGQHNSLLIHHLEWRHS